MAAINWIAVGAIGTMVLALATLAVVVTAKSASQDQRMALAFELLTGRTQRRSAGIAVLEGGMPRRWRKEALQLVARQAVYLLTQSESEDRSDEVKNLDNLISLFDKNRFESAQIDDARKDLIDAIDGRLRAAETSEPAQGLHLSTSKLVEWNKLLASPLSHTRPTSSRFWPWVRRR